MIDEKKLIEKINEKMFEVEVVSGKHRAFMKVVTLNNVKRIIAELPNAPDINVGNKWIPCDGCERKCEKWEHSKICQECDSTS